MYLFKTERIGENRTMTRLIRNNRKYVRIDEGERIIDVSPIIRYLENLEMNQEQIIQWFLDNSRSHYYNAIVYYYAKQRGIKNPFDLTIVQMKEKGIFRDVAKKRFFDYEVI